MKNKTMTFRQFINEEQYGDLYSGCLKHEKDFNKEGKDYINKDGVVDLAPKVNHPKAKDFEILYNKHPWDLEIVYSGKSEPFDQANTYLSCRIDNNYNIQEIDENFMFDGNVADDYLEMEDELYKAWFEEIYEKTGAVHPDCEK